MLFDIVHVFAIFYFFYFCFLNVICYLLFVIFTFYSFLFILFHIFCRMIATSPCWRSGPLSSSDGRLWDGACVSLLA